MPTWLKPTIKEEDDGADNNSLWLILPLSEQDQSGQCPSPKHPLTKNNTRVINYFNEDIQRLKRVNKRFV